MGTCRNRGSCKIVVFLYTTISVPSSSNHANTHTHIQTHIHTHTHTHTLISRGCSCRHAIVLKGHEKINLQCKCHIIETEHEANSGKPRKHIRSRKDGRYAGMANSGIPSCCLALLDQVSSKTPGPPAMWNFRPCSRTLHTHTHTHGAPTGAISQGREKVGKG